MSLLLLGTFLLLMNAPVNGTSAPAAEENGKAPGIAKTDPRLEQARGRLRPLKAGLNQTLTAALQQGSEEAIGLCRLEAPQIAQGASDERVTVGRTSHRLRNPGNAPAAWMKPYLREFQGSTSEPGDYRATTLPDGSFGYIEPIYVQALCLTCHGENLSKPIRAALKTHYPTDSATGFKAGDFRGLFWVHIEPPTPNSPQSR